mgnify:FL=1
MKLATAALTAALALSMNLSMASPACAQDEGPRLRWDDDWARGHPASWVVMTTGAAAALVFRSLYEPGSEALLREPTALDTAVRQHVMAPDAEDRERASRLSDVLLSGLILWPFIDSLLVAGVGDQNSDVAWQLFTVAAEALAADYALSSIVKIFVHRNRPHAERCSLEDRMLRPGRCGTEGRTMSFYSGHSSAAFNSAAVVCMTHAYLPLYGSDAADAFACGGSLILATTVAVLRVIADRHHATDVMLGALSGALTGALLPYLLHFGWDPVEGDADATAAPLRSATPVMFSAGGTF